MTHSNLDRLIYIDDSGDPKTGTAVYGWIEFSPDYWSDVLGQWIKHRKRLWGQYSIPVTKELHMTEYVLGRGRIAQGRLPEEFTDDNGETLWKNLGGKVANECLETIKCIEGLRVGAVYRQASDSSLLNEARSSLYKCLLERFEDELAQTESLAMVFMDGNGTDLVYRNAHRRLPRSSRRIIEDPIYTDSRHSQLTQMADHVAWCANAAIAQVPKHAFAHGWYEQYLSVRDLNRCPIELNS